MMSLPDDDFDIKEEAMKDTKIRQLLLSSSEEDLNIAGALMKQKDIIKEAYYSFEDIDLYEEKMKLKEVRDLQTRYPHFIIGGSIALFLHGARVKRWTAKYYTPDLDIITPYYTAIQDPVGNPCSPSSEYMSGNDFDEKITYGDTHIDLKVDPKEKYENIFYRGFTYKVGPLMKILEAKIKYSHQNYKHRADIEDMIGATIFKKYLEKVNKIP